MRLLSCVIVVVLASGACTPRATAPRVVAHPLGESTAPGPVVPPPLVTDQTRYEIVSSRPLQLAPSAMAATAPLPASTPVTSGTPVTPASTGAIGAAAAARAPAVSTSGATYTGGTSSPVAVDPGARIPPTPGGVSSETTRGTPSGAPVVSDQPSTPSGVPDTTNVPASTVPSGTPDVPATGVLAPPPPSEP